MPIYNNRVSNPSIAGFRYAIDIYRYFDILRFVSDAVCIVPFKFPCRQEN